MAEYKRKKFKKPPKMKFAFNKSDKSANRTKDAQDNITMHPVSDLKKIEKEKNKRAEKRHKKHSFAGKTRSAVKPSDEQGKAFKIIKGNKRFRSLKIRVSYGICAAVIIIVAAFHFALPTGISESVQNAYSAMGNGEIPAELQSSAVSAIKCVGNISYILSDSFLQVFNTNGKEMLYCQHGFSNPTMKTSEARTLIYDVGGYGVKILNDYELKTENSMTDTIFAGCITRNGYSAFATKATGYAAAVTVYDDDFKKTYTRYFADNLVSALALNNRGSKVATAEVYTQNGVSYSKISIFEYDSSKPIATEIINGAIVTELSDIGGYFVAVYDGGYSFFDWDGCKRVKESADNGFLYYDTTLSGESVFVSSKGGDYSENNVVIYDNDCEKVKSFSVKGAVKGVALNGNSAAFLLNDSIDVYSYDGKRSKSIDCGYNTYYIALLRSGDVAAISKSKFVVFEV